MSLRAGDRLGAYEVLAALGAGGMGEVYKARDTRLQRDVAIKILALRHVLKDDPLAAERFGREARAIAALNHPNIVTVYTVDDADGRAFIAMELVDGQTLAERIPSSGLDLHAVLAYAIPLADALSAAHDQGITHRDLKPGNVMVSKDGRIKVLDFGLAKLRDDVIRMNEGETTRAATGQGQIVGTVAYMSPEQASGAQVGARSDLFSFGVILYEMATGRRPFTGESGVSVLAAILKDTPKPVTELRPALPRDFARIVRRALTKDPEQRYQTAKDLRNDLQTLKDDLTSGEIAAAPAPAGRRSPAALIAVAALSLAVGVGGAYLWFGRAPAPDVAASATYTTTRLTSTGKAEYAAISPDGKYVAHTVNDQGESIWVLQTATGSNIPIVPPSDNHIFGLTFSPDGNYVYFMRQRGGATNDLFRVATIGGTPPDAIVLDVDSAPTFSHDGTRIAFLPATEVRLMTAPADGRDKAVILKPSERGRGFTYSVRPAWSPDGLRIAVARGGAGPTDFPGVTEGYVAFLDAATGEERARTTPRWSVIDSMAWLDEHSLVLSAAETGQVNFPIWRIGTDGSVRRVTPDLDSYKSLSVMRGPSPSIVAVKGDVSSTISVGKSDGSSSLAPVTRGAGRYDGQQALTWSDDGRLLYSASEGGQIDLWMTEGDLHNPRRLTSDSSFELQPCLTAGARSVVYVLAGAEKRGIARFDVQTRHTAMLTENALDWTPHCLNDDSVVFTRRSEGTYRVGVDGKPAIRIDPARTGGVPWEYFDTMTADKRFLAGFTWTPVRVTVVPVDGLELERPLKILSFPLILRFRDSDELGFLESAKHPRGIWLQPLAGGPPSFLTDVPGGERIFNFAFSPDGRLAISHGPATTDVVLMSGVK